MGTKIIISILAIGGIAALFAFTNIAPGNPLHQAIYGKPSCNPGAIWAKEVAIGDEKRKALAESGSDGHSIGSVDPNGSLARSNNWTRREPTSPQPAGTPNASCDQMVGRWQPINASFVTSITKENDRYQATLGDGPKSETVPLTPLGNTLSGELRGTGLNFSLEGTVLTVYGGPNPMTFRRDDY